MQVKLLNNELIQQIKHFFDVQLSYPVEIIYFSSSRLCYSHLTILSASRGAY
jgi:hypothetical protein